MPPSLLPCPACAELVVAGSCTCPHCGERKVCRAHGLSRAAMLMGIGYALAGCATPENDDTPPFRTVPGSDSDTTYEGTQSDYTGAATDDDDDEDGYVRGDDCDDENPEVHPGATETAGDGIDSNCDGEDDT